MNTQLRPSIQKRIEAIMDERDNLLNSNIQLTNIVDQLKGERDKLKQWQTDALKFIKVAQQGLRTNSTADTFYLGERLQKEAE